MHPIAQFILAACFLGLALPGAIAAGTRTHVSNNGNDANTAFSCDSAHPCRTFAAALTVTTPGGEILAIDSSGYGKVVIDRSVSIVAAPGVFAGIGVGSAGNATGVEINAPGAHVVLRGLTITGQGGAYGVRMRDGATLAVERCNIGGFASSSAVAIEPSAGVVISESLLRESLHGVLVSGGASTAIVDSRLLDNASGVTIETGAAGTIARATISGTTISGSIRGIWAYSGGYPSSGVRIDVIRSAISGSAKGVVSESSDGLAIVTLSDSVITGNNYGLLQTASGSGVAFLMTRGNNTVARNGIDTLGTIGTFPPI